MIPNNTFAFLWVATKREIKQLFLRQPMRLMFLFGAALAYLVVFGILYSPNIVKYTPIVIYDQDQSALSRDLVRQFDSTDAFRIIGNVDSEESMDKALRDKTAYGAVYIPKDFSKKVKTGSYSTALFVVNGSNIIITNITSTYAQDIVTDFSNRIAASQGALRLGINEEQLAKKINPVTYETRILNNPTQGYVLFFLIGLAMAAFQQGIFFTVGSSVHYEIRNYLARVSGVRHVPMDVDESMVSSEDHVINLHRARLLYVGKYIAYWLMANVSFLIILLFSHFALDLPVKAPLYEVFGLASVYAFAFIGFAMLVALLCTNELQFIRIAVMYPVPAFILSGYTWPQPSMGPVLEVISYFFPIAWLSNEMRQLFTAGYAEHLGLNLIVLFVFGLVCSLLAFWRVRYTVKKIS